MTQILDDLTVEIIAKKTGLPYTSLLELANDAPFLYYEKSISKNGGGIRKLEIPHLILKNFQKKLLEKILNKISTHPKLYGKAGTSTKKAVADHVKKAMVITMDIKDFFPSIKVSKIKNLFIQNGATNEVAKILTRLVTRKNHLPQGAPTSPYVGRLVLQKFAEELEKLLGKIPKSSFSIYVDDITISGPKGIKRIQNTISKILKHHGFGINENKTKVMNRDDEQVSLNICLNNRIEATKKFLKEIEKLAKKVPASDSTLQGKKSYVKYLMKPEK